MQRICRYLHIIHCISTASSVYSSHIHWIPAPYTSAQRYPLHIPPSNGCISDGYPSVRKVDIQWMIHHSNSCISTACVVDTLLLGNRISTVLMREYVLVLQWISWPYPSISVVDIHRLDDRILVGYPVDMQLFIQSQIQWI